MSEEIGTVVWFDQKKGFGFVKILTPNSEFLNKEVFVHYSNIQAESSFKKLYPGESVSLNVEKNSEGSDKEFSSSNIRGVMGLPLLVDNPDYIYRLHKKDRGREVTNEVDEGEGEVDEGEGENE